MNVKITYPHVEEKKIRRQDVIQWAKWPFLLAAIACAAVNIATGLPAWCLISIWACWMVWSFFISPELVERNRISLWIHFITSTAILLFLIDMLFPSGWSAIVVPIVYFGGLLIAGIMFFSNFQKQKQNMMPLLLLLATCFFYSISQLLWGRMNWETMVMGISGIVLLAVCLIVLGKDFLREIKKRFHTR